MNFENTYEKRLEKLENYGIEEGFDAIVIYSDVWRCGNVQFFTGWIPTGGGIGQASTLLIIFPGQKPILGVGYEQEEEAKKISMLTATSAENAIELISKKKSIKKAGIIGTNIIPYNMYKTLLHEINADEMIDITGVLDKWKMVKEDWEIRLLEEASRISEIAIETAINSISKGISEIEVMSSALSEIMKRKALPSFYPVVSFNENTAIPMRFPTNSTLEKPGLVMLDFGAKIEGFAGDITRTIRYGSISEEEEKIVSTAIEANEKTKKFIKPGIKSSDVNDLVIKHIEELGMGDYIEHPSSHGIGMDHEEYFPVDPAGAIQLAKNMIFTVEAGVYVPGVGGARVEDVVIITEDGCRGLTSFDRDITLQ